ncbi:hypothetical protein PF005_g18256 [Phytophthora fragariae]|uniref:Transmembrane protein n=1 Tax=Phytophthora fragariae TaxID=53985 RepID=A0A6A3RAD8_9STRA|nr:hypothetical protein PF003_g850 [Phytophthora fragariae]KAE8930725.1 hypothetical protein PF009_g19191 [Phytophthora fragariae]KAE8993451.1 hypothetical protein PF011_g17137 [Phytophthora fragariae]KAE9092703.1 hypothetical protein PF007_g18386 [Phytophthora fragariae]KAE9092802.1 hypothetical protein PF010_g17720 [Phytophthora fragariae]
MAAIKKEETRPILAIVRDESNMSRRTEARTLLGLTMLWRLALAVDVGDNAYNRLQALRRLGSIDVDGTSSSDDDASMTPVQKQQEQDNMTIQPDTTDSSDSDFPSTSVIVVAVGLVVLTGLVFLLVVLRRGRGSLDQTDSEAPTSRVPPDNSRLCMKRTTFAVPETNRAGLGAIDSSGSVVPVLGDDASHRKMCEASRLDSGNSWAEATSYSVAPLSSRHTRPAQPMLIYTPARHRGLNDSQAASDYSSHTDDYSIGILESPVSTVYSFGSESDDMFPSTSWDEVDSYRSLDCTFLSTTSSNVFGSNRDRSGGAWKKVYGPTTCTDSPTDSDIPRLSPGVLFVRQMDSNEMRRMRLDPRARGARNYNRMRFDVEV